jgi:ketosteroid isomerase-like protein
MRAARCVVAVAALALCTHGATAQARPQSADSSMRDTLPEHVALRAYAAWKAHDLDATYANYDSVYTVEVFNHPAGSHQVRNAEHLQKMKADTTVLRIVRSQRVELVRSDAYGAFVVQEWTEAFPDGRVFRHFELFEVRHGKIVREIEGDRLLNPSG